MAAVFSLLTFPVTSTALSDIKPSIFAEGNYDSLKPNAGSRSEDKRKHGSDSSPSTPSTPLPHKAIRLGCDSDAPSASRSPAMTASTSTVAEGMPPRAREAAAPGPIQLQIVDEDGSQIAGKFNVAPAGGATDPAFTLLHRCLRVLLTRLNAPPLPATYESILRSCQSVVVYSGKGEGVYDTLKLELEKSLSKVINELLLSPDEGPTRMDPVLHVKVSTNIAWLGDLVEACDWFEKQADLLRSVLTYLDQCYIVSKPGLLGVKELAHSLFSQRILADAQVCEKMMEGVKEWLTWERSVGLEHQFRHHIPDLISHLVTHGRYNLFEQYYIDLTRAFYENESKTLYARCKDKPDEFFSHVRKRLAEEEKRSKEMLLAGSLGSVQSTTEEALLDGRLEWLSGIVGKYLASKDFDSLASMYELFKRVEGESILRNTFKDYIQSNVQKIVSNATLDDEMVQRLLELKSAADDAIARAFIDDKPETPQATTYPRPTPDTPANSKPGGASTIARVPNRQFVYALSDAFTVGFKARRNKPAEMIAKYLDSAMRKGQGSTSDESFERSLDEALALYRFTDDKDVFRTFYHRALAKRLLMERSASNDFETAMLKKLKEKYDPEFGMGEEMFKDLALSREMMRDYHAKLPANDPAQKLSVMVLQRSAWPFSVRDKSVDLPPNMQNELVKFTKHYKTKHQGHVLTWDHALGTAALTAQFRDGPKDLSVGLFQAVVLLLFNESDELKLGEIRAATRMEDAELKRTLQSLACGKKRVLKKTPIGREVGEGDTFKFNVGFDDPHPKIHINSIQAKVTVEESQRVERSIEGDRKHYLDAAIVRIMKAKREMTYEQLKAATIDAVKSHFVPQVDAIKKRIDSLVESDYLERSERDKNVFRYVA